jgi:8-oxo-dGTP diphosphatase
MGGSEIPVEAGDGMHSVAMVGIVEKDGRILIIRRADNGRWEPPAGIMEKDETFQECVVREILEETGVTASPVRITGVYKNMVHPKRPVTVAWLCRYVSGEPTPSGESSAVEWASREEVVRRVAPAHAARITDALDYDGEVVARPHDGSVFLD